ncbi:MAG TPA: extracellular solute-binding protein [Clostridiales bacterium]|jgi:iron(III) transport system substrate-binding protein|nr:extracellular solute-binding protein [Clostridiales bacterium]
MKKFAALLLAALMMFGAVSALAGGSLVIYSPHDADPLQAGISLFRAAYPDIKVEYIAAGTGELLQRVAAESENPLADVLWGGGADSLAAFKPYFQPYVCANDDVIADDFKDAEDLWIGESPLPMVLFYNKNLVPEDEAPKGWEDLLNPKWKGMIAYASPAKSGSAYTQLCTMILAQGGPEGGGWDFVEKFYQNLDGKVQDSSGNCHKLVASGEYAIGVTIEKSAVLYADNPDVAFVYPAQNSAVPDGVAIIKNAPNLENAKLFVDFVTGLECQKDQNVNWKRRPVRSDLEPVGLLPLSELDLTNYDFDWAANEKETIIEKWQEIIVNN